MEVSFSPQFRRQFKKLEPSLQEEVLEKIELFESRKNHSFLRVHKLRGRLSGRMSFSVNYKYRIVFVWETKDKAALLLAVGDHTVYE